MCSYHNGHIQDSFIVEVIKSPGELAHNTYGIMQRMRLRATLGLVQSNRAWFKPPIGKVPIPVKMAVAENGKQISLPETVFTFDCHPKERLIVSGLITGKIFL